MNEQVTNVLVGIVGLYVLKLVGDFLATFLKGRIFDGPAKTEQNAASKLDQVLEKTGKIENSLAQLATNLENHKVTVHELRERLEGFSANHGQRITGLEERVTRVEERSSVVGELERVLDAPRKRRGNK